MLITFDKLYDFDLVDSLVTEFYAAEEPTTKPAPIESAAQLNGNKNEKK